MLGRIAGRVMISVLAAATLAGAAFAAEFKPYSDKAFAQAQAEGRSILIEVHAWWCSTCNAQEPALHKAAKDPAFDNVIIFKMDYDREKKARQTLQIQQQSTLISYFGAQERGRSIGMTDSYNIGNMLRLTLK